MYPEFGSNIPRIGACRWREVFFVHALRRFCGGQPQERLLMLRWYYSTNLPCDTSQSGMQEKNAVFISLTYICLYIYLIFITFMHNLIRIFNKLYCFHLPGYDMIKFWKYLLRATGYAPSGTRLAKASRILRLFTRNSGYAIRAYARLKLRKGAMHATRQITITLYL